LCIPFSCSRTKYPSLLPFGSRTIYGRAIECQYLEVDHCSKQTHTLFHLRDLIARLCLLCDCSKHTRSGSSKHYYVETEWDYRTVRACLHLHSECIFFFLVSWGGVRLSPTGTSATIWPIVPASDDRWWWVWSRRWNENWQGKPKYSEKICPSVTLSITDPTWPDLGSNPGHPGGKPATNRLSYGTASECNLAMKSYLPEVISSADKSLKTAEIRRVLIWTHANFITRYCTENYSNTKLYLSWMKLMDVTIL
jgi:hypothetical protein